MENLKIQVIASREDDGIKTSIQTDHKARVFDLYEVFMAAAESMKSFARQYAKHENINDDDVLVLRLETLTIGDMEVIMNENKNPTPAAPVK